MQSNRFQFIEQITVFDNFLLSFRASNEHLAADDERVKLEAETGRFALDEMQKQLVIQQTVDLLTYLQYFTLC